MRHVPLIIGAACAVFVSNVTAQAQQPVAYNTGPSFDYVQQAGGMTFDGQTLTLTDIAPATVFFTDRPYRMSGQFSNAAFASLWRAPNGTFAGDPPNAAVSVLGDTANAPAIVELTSAEADGSSLRYDVTVLSGMLPASADNVAVFIDKGKSKHQAGYYPPPPPPGPYCYHAPQAPECRAYYPYPYFANHPAAAAVAADIAAAAGYTYPIPAGPIPMNCHINQNHTRMICSTPLQ
ncbi:hypothetical protein [Bauldia sp.]|uniref:hypothetical protein n=1 Tax=Bauldia sp. TaxID=2575872 RepID=UPI003BAD47B4